MNDKELLLIEQIVKETLEELDEGKVTAALKDLLIGSIVGVLVANGLMPDKMSSAYERYKREIVQVVDSYLDNAPEEELEKLIPHAGEKPLTPADIERGIETGRIMEQVLALFEARKSTKGYIYEVAARMITSRDRNKSEIINDLRAIKYVTVVSIVPGQNFALQKTPTKEKTLIKIKFHPKGSPIKTVQKIKASAFGRSLDADCPNVKIQGLLELDIKRDTLTPVRTY
jgi:hypothetical protein